MPLMAFAPSAPPDTVAPVQLRVAIERAMGWAELTHKEIADLQGIKDKSQWYRQLEGREALSYARLLSIATTPKGRRFWQALIHVQAESFGLRIEPADALCAALGQALQTVGAIVAHLQQPDAERRVS